MTLTCKSRFEQCSETRENLQKNGDKRKWRKRAKFRRYLAEFSLVSILCEPDASEKHRGTKKSAHITWRQLRATGKEQKWINNKSCFDIRLWPRRQKTESMNQLSHAQLRSRGTLVSMRKGSYEWVRVTKIKIGSCFFVEVDFQRAFGN